LLRGDFQTRMEGLSQGVQNALITPNEGRKMDNRPPLPGGDALHLQKNMSELNEVGDDDEGQT